MCLHVHSYQDLYDLSQAPARPVERAEWVKLITRMLLSVPEMQNMLKYAVLILWRKKGVAANFYAFCISAAGIRRECGDM